MERDDRHASREGFYRVTWKRYLLPSVHPEGVKILIALFGLFVLANGGLFFAVGYNSFWLWAVGIPLLIFSFYFFRNPDRIPPGDEDAILAPADGIVCGICRMVPPSTLGLGSGERIRVSTFMSLFSVHVNRNPVSGTVVALTYHKGRFVNVARKDSDDNERQEICIERSDGIRVGVVQIAGLVARRIFCPLKQGEQVTGGSVFGMIRFGSRLDVYLPVEFQCRVLPGQTMIAGETILGRMDQGKGKER